VKKLFYFTNSYPYGLAESWKKDELEFLSSKFKEIHVIPNNFGNSKEFKGIEKENIFYYLPLFEEQTKKRLRKKVISILFSQYVFQLLKELLFEIRSFDKIKIEDLLESTHRVVELSKNKKFQEFQKQISKNDLIIFFWGRGTSEYLGLNKIEGKSIIRFHGFDLYNYRQQSKIIPYQKSQVLNANLSLCISKNGEIYLKNKYPILKDKINLNYLGSKHPNNNCKLIEITNVSSKVFTIFTCSMLIPLKRLDLLMDALIGIRKQNIKWIHIGDGEERIELEKKSTLLGDNITFYITGWLSREEIFKLYFNEKPKLFINVSNTEGLPVSIIEACSFGVPILATDVGGNSEIVDVKNGILVRKGITPNELKMIILEFTKKSVEELAMFSQNSYVKYSNHFELLLCKNQLMEYIDGI
jgi:colanic acid/amylovoran biosynthesis glycosyltransferase